MAGSVVGIFIAPAEGAAVAALDAVRAVPGRGLEGDRYFKRAADPQRADPSEEVTLIASEGLEEARSEHGLYLAPGEHRRNVVTAGVVLDDLIGKTFRIGEGIFEGLETNPPCRYLARVTGKAVVKPLIDRGGIRACVVQEGVIRVGDVIEAVTAERGD